MEMKLELFISIIIGDVGRTVRVKMEPVGGDGRIKIEELKHQVDFHIEMLI